MRRFILILLAATMFFTFTAPKAEAIDPVTLAILAPMAIRAAEIARPYVLKGLVNTGQHFLRMGKDMLEILLLPWGILQLTVGLPFGGFRPGLRNTIQGGIAPFRLIIHTLVLPVAMFGGVKS